MGLQPRSRHCLASADRRRLLGLILLMLVLRYLKEVANARMSMEMVFYIREGVYDKLQRLGFAFHDAVIQPLVDRPL